VERRTVGGERDLDRGHRARARGGRNRARRDARRGNEAEVAEGAQVAEGTEGEAPPEGAQADAPAEGTPAATEGTQAEAPAEPAEAATQDAETAEAPAGSDDPLARSNALIEEARAAHSARDDANAERLYREAIEAASFNARAHGDFAEFLYRSQRAADARDHAERAVNLQPNRVSYRILLGDIYRSLNRGGAAAEQWRRALELRPGDERIQRRLDAHE
jgi:tetratricopeptide (TPR) repeat protein